MKKKKKERKKKKTEQPADARKFCKSYCNGVQSRWVFEISRPTDGECIIFSTVEMRSFKCYLILPLRCVKERLSFDVFAQLPVVVSRLQ